MNAHATINSGIATGWFNWDPSALMVDQEPMLRPVSFALSFWSKSPVAEALFVPQITGDVRRHLRSMAEQRLCQNLLLVRSLPSLYRGAAFPERVVMRRWLGRRLDGTVWTSRNKTTLRKSLRVEKKK
jgi:hypothetical protein